MTPSSSRLTGYATLAWFASSHWRQLRQPLLRDQLLRQVHAAGITALPVIAALAVLTGATSVSQLVALVDADSDLAQQILFLGLFYEAAPLLCALVVVARSSAAIASELAVMGMHDEFTALRRIGVAAADYLLLPRIIGLALALPVTTVFFQTISLGSGWLAVALLHQRPMQEVAGRFLDIADPALVLLSVLKSALGGAVVGIIACHHGGNAGHSPQAISAAAMQAVGGGLVAVFVIDVAFAALAWVIR